MLNLRKNICLSPNAFFNCPSIELSSATAGRDRFVFSGDLSVLSFVFFNAPELNWRIESSNATFPLATSGADGLVVVIFIGGGTGGGLGGPLVKEGIGGAGGGRVGGRGGGGGGGAIGCEWVIGFGGGGGAWWCDV